MIRYSYILALVAVPMLAAAPWVHVDAFGPVYAAGLLATLAAITSRACGD
jgi:hypothetical protein